MYATIHKHATNRDIDVKDYEDLSREQQKIAYKKFVIKRKKDIEKECMLNYWFDKNGNTHQLLTKDSYVKEGS